MESSSASSPRRLTRKESRIALLFSVTFVMMSLLLATGGCSGKNQGEVDLFEPYRSAVKEEFQSDFDLVQTAPRYAINVTVDPALDILTGTARIHITNDSPDPWRHLVFRFYPMLQQYGGEMTMLGALVNDGPTNFVYLADTSAVQVDMKKPLLAGEEATVDLSWKLTIPTWSDSSTTYALFGNSQRMTSLPLFYPALAVYQPGLAIGTGRWWLDKGSVRGDSAFNLTSLFSVTAKLPADQVPVATGSLVMSETINEDQVAYTWVTGPVREFLLHMSPDFLSTEMEAYGTKVVSYYLPGDEKAAKMALTHAVGALRFYSDYFGEYPFMQMSLAPAPLSYRGMEYPQVSLLGVDLYSTYAGDLETLAAHEIAHQWWFQIVHNDPVNEPWLDEGLAEFSMGLYFEALRGKRYADLVELQRWQVPLSLQEEEYGEIAMGQPVDEFANNSQYETVVYAKGALLYARLRNILGERRFRAFLRDYLDEHRYQIVDTGDWLDSVRALNEPEALELYRAWVEAPASELAIEASDSVTSTLRTDAQD